MKIYDFEVEDEIQKVEIYLKNVEIIKNSFADNTSRYRNLSLDIGLEFQVLRDCIESYERALLIGVYTYAEQLVKNFYYQLLEKDSAQNIYIRNFINKKLDTQKFSPNVSYAVLENSIKNELGTNFRFIINKNREEILKYDDLIKDRHRYAHRGIYQSSFEQYRDVIKVEKYITAELVMIVNHGMDYRIHYQNCWKYIVDQLTQCCGLYKELKNNNNKELKKKFISELKDLRNKTREFLRNYNDYIDKGKLLNEIKIQLERINTMDLRITSSFALIEDLEDVIKTSKIIYLKN